jgi:choice-of-anchor A domain-containing protein
VRLGVPPAVLTCLLLLLLAPPPARAQGPIDCAPQPEDGPLVLGPAAPYAEFVLEDARQINETEGRLAVGGDFTVSDAGDVGFRTGFGLPPDPTPSLVVGGTLTTAGTYLQLLTTVPGVLGRGTYGGGYVPGPRDEGTIVEAPPPFPLGPARTYLRSVATLLGRCEMTPGASIQPFGGATGTLLLRGTSARRNIFRLDGARLQDTVSVYIDVPIGSTTLVVVTGDRYTTEDAPNADFWIRAPGCRARRSCRSPTAG